MHWLIDLVVALAQSFTDARDRDRSLVGEAPLDRRARRVGFALLALLILVAAVWIYLAR